MKNIEENSFVVGGAVRDLVLGREPNDVDYVVVGMTPQDMFDAGFSQVGADFPVFLHPVTGDEYALARTERKSGKGYKGFETDFNPNITLEQDLERRDFTCNAMAMPVKAFVYKDLTQIIDPFGGRSDLLNKFLIATNENAFIEDPLRVLRAARFAAKLDLAPTHGTWGLCADVGHTTEFAEITAERVGIELLKALDTDNPRKFFDFLKEIKILDVHFPEIAALIGQTQPEKWHPEGDSYEHTMQVLQQAAVMRFDNLTRWCALTHDLGKGLTPKEELPHHYGHEAAGVPVVAAMADRLKLGNEYKDFGKFTARWHMHVHKTFELNPKSFVKIYESVPHAKIRELVNVLTDVALCDARGRGPESQGEDYPQRIAFFDIMNAVDLVKARNLFTEEELKSASVGSIKNKLYTARRAAAKYEQSRAKMNRQ